MMLIRRSMSVNSQKVMSRWPNFVPWTQKVMDDYNGYELDILIVGGSGNGRVIAQIITDIRASGQNISVSGFQTIIPK